MIYHWLETVIICHSLLNWSSLGLIWIAIRQTYLIVSCHREDKREFYIQKPIWGWKFRFYVFGVSRKQESLLWSDSLTKKYQWKRSSYYKDHQASSGGGT